MKKHISLPILIVAAIIVVAIAIVLWKEYMTLPDNGIEAVNDRNPGNEIFNGDVPVAEAGGGETKYNNDVNMPMSIQTNPISMPYFVSENGGLYIRENEIEPITLMEINVIIRKIIGDEADICALSTGFSSHIKSARSVYTIKMDGSVWQLVEDPDDGQYSLEKVNGIEGCVKVSGGYEHAMALTADGYVYAWGNNTYGQLGNMDDGYRETPERVRGLSGIIDISSGNMHCMALGANGKVYTWGDNSQGQIGNGSYARSKEESKQGFVYQVDGLSEIVQVSAAWDTSIALQNNGTVFEWGSNASANVFCMPAPTQMRLKDIVQISSYGLRMMGLSSTGEVWVWGVRHAEPGEFTDPPYKAGCFPDAMKVVAGERDIVITGDQEIWQGVIGKVDGDDRGYYHDAEFVCMFSKEDVQTYGIKLYEK